MESQLFLRWRNAITSVFGRNSRKHQHAVMRDIMAVDTGLKLSFLVDYMSSSASDWRRLLCALTADDIISHPLLVILLDETEIFIVRDDLISCLTEEPIPVGVDVSVTNTCPVVLNHSVVEHHKHVLLQCLENMMKEKQSYESELLPRLCLPTSVNRTTIYGLLLGYPLVYWFTTSENTSDNCLTMEPLTVHRACASQDTCGTGTAQTADHVLFSFSVPEKIDSKERIEKWKIALRDKFDSQQFFTNLLFDNRDVALSSVML